MLEQNTCSHARGIGTGKPAFRSIGTSGSACQPLEDGAYPRPLAQRGLTRILRDVSVLGELHHLVCFRGKDVGGASPWAEDHFEASSRRDDERRRLVVESWFSQISIRARTRRRQMAKTYHSCTHPDTPISRPWNSRLGSMHSANCTSPCSSPQACCSWRMRKSRD